MPSINSCISPLINWTSMLNPFFSSSTGNFRTLCKNSGSFRINTKQVKNENLWGKWKRNLAPWRELMLNVFLQNSKLESESYTTPSFLTEKLLDKCNEFETVCDQIYYILVSINMLLVGALFLIYIWE